VDSARSVFHETAEEGVLETLRSGPFPFSWAASPRLLRRLSRARDGPWEDRRRVLDLKETRRSLREAVVGALKSSSFSFSSRDVRFLVCALSYLSIFMFLKLSEMVEWERDGS